MNRYRVSALALGAATILAVVGGLPGQAMAASSTGSEAFTLVLDGSGSGLVLAHGVFNAQGTDVERQKTGRTGTSTFKFANGSVNVLHTDDKGGTTTFSRKTCSAHITGSGDYQMTSGTGAYTGIAAHGEYTVNGTLIFAHTSTGCSKNPTGQLVIVHAGGPVSIPS